MADKLLAEYLYWWGFKLTGASAFPTVVRKAQRELNAGREFSLNELMDAFSDLRRVGLVRFLPDIGDRQPADFLHSPHHDVEFMTRGDTETLLESLRS